MRHVVVARGGAEGYEGGTLELAISRGFGVHGELFWSERFSTRVGADFVNPEAILFPTSAEPIDLGTLGINPISATARWYFRDGARLRPYVGGGGALVLIGNLDDYFDERIEADFDPELTYVVEGGLRYRRSEHVAFDLGLAFMPVTAESQIARTNVALPTELELDPIVLGIGVSWRF